MKDLGVLVAHLSRMRGEGWIGLIALAELALVAAAILSGEGVIAWLAFFAMPFAVFAIYAVIAVANRKS